MERSSGILLHISSLPSPYGIGTLGKEARSFADFLKAAGQTYWQMLPVGQTGYGDSPYQPFSTFAGNPYFIDLDELKNDGLLTSDELGTVLWGENARAVDYGRIYEYRFAILKRAFDRARTRDFSEAEAFFEENADWLDDYALFMAVKAHFDMHSWYTWDDDIRLRKPCAIKRYRSLLSEEIRFYSYLQYLFFKQWKVFRTYVNGIGIKLIGDLPIYVSPDSADVWADPSCFRLDENAFPTFVAGVPPDYFSSTGQLWGNPLYAWDHHKKAGYAWWLKRFAAAAELFDTLRIDHFRGFESYWSVPYGDVTAERGTWEKGPGLELIDAVKLRFPRLSIIAEDLGVMTDAVRKLLRASGFPGMKVLQFAFDAGEENDYLPHTYTRNCVCYTGTHDNDTLAGWLYGASEHDRAFMKEYLGLNGGEGLAHGVMRGGLSSVAALFIAPMQDHLGLGSDCRMNRPSTLGGNWAWRLYPHECTDALAASIRRSTAMYGRIPAKTE
ncbi:MAG TPA: 4-alpha-glucanotransferase [Clostridia bacterium]|nr:4-alpha-glucanotransferase [Clostridia bacterium]